MCRNLTRILNLLLYEPYISQIGDLAFWIVLNFIFKALDAFLTFYIQNKSPYLCFVVLIDLANKLLTEYNSIQTIDSIYIHLMNGNIWFPEKYTLWSSRI